MRTFPRVARRVIAAVLVSACLAALHVAAQQRSPQPLPQPRRGQIPVAAAQRGPSLPAGQAPPSPFVIRINVNLVQVDAVVTDSKGKPVTDLKAEDFEIFQDGKPQPITTFEFVDVKGSSVRVDVAAAGAARGRGAPARGVPAPAQTRGLRQGQIRRTMAFVVDDLGLSFDGIVHVRDSLKKWVDNEMQQGDLVAVIRTSAGMGSLQQFTSDKRQLLAAIALIKFRVGRVGVSSFAPLTAAPPPGSADTETFDRELSQMYSVGSLGAIQYVVRGLRDVPGRKNLILFSESMQLMFPDGRNQEVEDRLRRLTDAANRSSVVIYAVDPRGVVYTGLTAEDSGNGRSPRQLAQVGSNRTTQLINSREGMETLAQKTGGLFIHDNNDISAAVRQAADDGSGYYLLGYNPDDSTFQLDAAKFHSISVRLKRPGLTVRSRTGFFGSPDRGTPPPRTPIEQIQRALSAPFATGDVRVRLTTLFSNDPKKGSSIDAMLHFDLRDLTFTTDTEGVLTSQIDIAAVTFDVEGNQIDGASKTWRLHLTKADYDAVVNTGIVYTIHVPVKKPGPYQMRVVLRDDGSQRIGSATQFIEIPDMKKNHLALSGLLVGGHQSTPASGKIAEGQLETNDVNPTPAVRVFTPGTSITYAYEIFNARRDRQNKPQLAVETRLFRDGQQVNTATSTSPFGDGQSLPERLIVVGNMQLNQVPPGDYMIQVVVTDKLAPEKNRIAAQAMDFEVR